MKYGTSEESKHKAAQRRKRNLRTKNVVREKPLKHVGKRIETVEDDELVGVDLTRVKSLKDLE